MFKKLIHMKGMKLINKKLPLVFPVLTTKPNVITGVETGHASSMKTFGLSDIWQPKIKPLNKGGMLVINLDIA